MEINIPPPSPLLKSEDMAQNWIMWKKDFLTYMRVSKSFGKPNDVKAYILRNCIGEVGQRIIEEIAMKDSSHLYNMNLLIQKLDEYFLPTNEIRERYKFFTMQKKTMESIADYIISLEEKAKYCNFGNMKEHLIRDKIIAEIKDKQLLQKLFETKYLDLSKLTSIWFEYKKDAQKCRSYQNDNNTKSNENQSTIDKTSRDIPPYKRCCWKCSTWHPIKSCPAWGIKCLLCNNYNHYTSNCRQTKQAIPSAPPLLEFERLYPDLNNANVKNTWSWIEQPQTQTENLQKSDVPNKLEPTEQKDPTATGNRKRKQNFCFVS